MAQLIVLLAGVSMVLSIFLIVVTHRAARSGGMKILRFLEWSFATFLIANLIFVLSVFRSSDFSRLVIPVLLFSELIVMLLFYLGIVRRS